MGHGLGPCQASLAAADGGGRSPKACAALFSVRIFGVQLLRAFSKKGLSPCDALTVVGRMSLCCSRGGSSPGLFFQRGRAIPPPPLCQNPDWVGKCSCRHVEAEPPSPPPPPRPPVWGCPPGERPWPTARAVALLRVDPTQGSETGTVRGIRWHHLPRERKGESRGKGRPGREREGTRG